MKIKEMTASIKNELKIFASLSDLSRFYNYDVFDWVEKIDVDLKIILSYCDSLPEHLSELDHKKIRTVDSDSQKKCFIMNDNHEMLIFLKNSNSSPHKISALWSNSETLFDTMSYFFDLSWGHAKPLK